MLKLRVEPDINGFKVLSEPRSYMVEPSDKQIQVEVEIKSINASTAKYGGILDALEYLVDSSTEDPLVESENGRYLEES